jgi:hypothetical protein
MSSRSTTGGSWNRDDGDGFLQIARLRTAWPVLAKSQAGTHHGHLVRYSAGSARRKTPPHARGAAAPCSAGRGRQRERSASRSRAREGAGRAAAHQARYHRRAGASGRSRKVHNINLALAEHDISAFDWLIVTDDDITFPPDFLDSFLCLATKADLRLVQPAHRFYSFNRFLLTYRAWNSLVRLTNFVESGPIIALHRDSFGLLLPFPELRWSWGVDIIWSEIGSRHGLRLGIVDTTPIEHLKPISSNYDYKAAITEAREFLRQQGVTSRKKDILKNLGVVPA